MINIHVEWENGSRVACRKLCGKCALHLHTCISETVKVKIHEQNKLIQTEFKGICVLLQRVMTGSYPVWYRILQYWQDPVFYRREKVSYEV